MYGEFICETDFIVFPREILCMPNLYVKLTSLCFPEKFYVSGIYF